MCRTSLTSRLARRYLMPLMPSLLGLGWWEFMAVGDEIHSQYHGVFYIVPWWYHKERSKISYVIPGDMMCITIGYFTYDTYYVTMMILHTHTYIYIYNIAGYYMQYHGISYIYIYRLEYHGVWYVIPWENIWVDTWLFSVFDKIAANTWSMGVSSNCN